MGAALGFGLLVGLVFGVAARAGRLCLLRGMREARRGDATALRAFVLAMAAAVALTQGLVAAGALDLTASLPLRPQWSWTALLAGGAIFGVGMVLANACGARSVVLAAGGNLRSVLVLGVMALTAQASLTGVLAPLRMAVQSLGAVEPAALSLADLAAPAFGDAALARGAVAGLMTAALAAFAWPVLRRAPVQALAALVIGAAVAGGWWAVYAADDPFDPKTLNAVSFVGPTAESLLWVMLSSGRAAGFGVGLIGGTLAGALLTALAMRDFRVETFGSPAQALRAIGGGVLMGFGGVLATGCSIGQGLSGVSTLSLASLVAFVGILAGIAVTLTILPDSQAKG